MSEISVQCTAKNSINVAGNWLKKFFARDYLREDHELVSEYRRQRDAAIAERQARAQNPAKLRELPEIIDAAGQSVVEPIWNVEKILIWMKNKLFL